MEEYIKLLDLPDEFNLADLKKAYRKKVLQYHPDKAANEAERVGFEALMKKLNEANDYLKDYLERHDGKYSKTEEYTNSYNSSDDSDSSAQENYEKESSQEDYQEEEYHEEHQEEYREEEYREEDYQEDRGQYTPEENYENIDYIGKIIDFYKLMFNPVKVFKVFKELYGKNPKRSIIAIIIALLTIPFWNKVADNVYPNSSQTYTQELQQETKQESKKETAIQQDNQNTIQDNSINQQPHVNNEKVFQGVEKSEWDIYMRDLNRRIKSNWMMPKGMEKIDSDKVKAVVNFNISKEGKLINEPVIKESSGIEKVDLSCIEAIKLTAPFRPLPSRFTGEYLDASFTFEAERYGD